MAWSLKKLDWKILLLLPVPLFWIFLADDGKLNAVENLLLDLRFRARGEMTAPVKVFYVDLDTRGIQKIGESPWSRGRFAEAAESLFEHGRAKGVGFDFVFSDYGRSELVNKVEAVKGNRALALVGLKYPQLVFGAKYTQGMARTQEGERRFPLLRQGFNNRERNDVPELPQYQVFRPDSVAAIGLIDIDYDYGQDQVPRWAPLFAESFTTDFWHFGLQLACIELGVPPGSIRRDGEFLEIFNAQDEVLRRIPLTASQLLEINWFSPWDDQFYNPRSSIADVLIAGEMLKSDKPEERAQAARYFQRFADAIVIIGPVDPLLQDLGPTPFDADPVAKVGAHGNLLKTIIAEQYLSRVPSWMHDALVLGLSLVVTTLTIVGGARSLFAKVLAVLLLIGYLVVAFHQFGENNLILPITAPIGAAFSTGFIATLWQLVREEKQKGRIKNMFGTYLAPELVNSMIESKTDPQLGGHEEIITAYFSDIQSFSKFSEQMSPAQLVEFMNEYLTACTDLIHQEKGTLDKYIGDAVVAIFGAPVPLPDHAYRACVATQRVQQKIAALREKWKAEGDKWPPIVHVLRARLGLNTGSAIIGNMGSRSRFSYTMMGDNVNLAARMESGAKSLGVFTMVTEATKLECEKHGADHVVFRYLDRIVVMGRSKPVPVFEIVGLKEDVSAQTFECLRIYGQAVGRYLARDWDGALELLAQSAALEPHQPNEALAIKINPSLVLRERCYAMKTNPPGPGWDGTYVMEEK